MCAAEGDRGDKEKVNWVREEYGRKETMEACERRDGGWRAQKQRMGCSLPDLGVLRAWAATSRCILPENTGRCPLNSLKESGS